MTPLAGPQRLLATRTGRTASLAEHRQLFGAGSLPKPMEELERSGLLGRGGGGFETARKVALLRSQRSRHRTVVVNAMEGEPAANKDKHLLRLNPHLVLDGAEMLAELIHADQITICIAREHAATIAVVKRAVHERERQSLRGPAITVETPPGRYVAGEESALVHWLNDNEALPQFRPEKPSVLRVRRHPALVENAETCAHLGLITRWGASWFRSQGTPAHPGTMLVSISGAVPAPRVIEVAVGTRIRDILAAVNSDPAPQGLVVGGYGGAVFGPTILDLPYSNEALAPLGAGVGAGILCPIPATSCGLRETFRVAAWMANESARQCGPCAFGLPAIADDLHHVAFATRDARAAAKRLEQRFAEIAGRGACRHPDGVIRFVRTALDTFRMDVTAHLTMGACAGVNASPLLMVPALTHEEALEWE